VMCNLEIRGLVAPCVEAFPMFRSTLQSMENMLFKGHLGYVLGNMSCRRIFLRLCKSSRFTFGGRFVGGRFDNYDKVIVTVRELRLSVP
jgi:hypothetical protein